MRLVDRNTQKKIVRGLVRIWVMQKPIVIAALLAVAADITGVCLLANAAKPDSVKPAEVSYEEAPAPVANVADYADIFGSDTKKAAPSKQTGTTGESTEENAAEDEEAPTVLGLNSATKPGYMNNCYFLGDSRLVAMVSYGFVSDSNVLAKIGVSHTAVENTTFMQNSGKQYSVKQYLTEKKPPVVYVCYGVNGMNGISEEKYEKSYKTLVEHIMEWAPDSKIVLMSIWPVDDNGPYKGSVKNEWIEKYNNFLLALAEYEGLYYLDVASVLKGSDGQIKPEFDGGDGLHYKASAYNTIIDYIYHHPVKGISDEGEFKVKYVKPSGEFKKMMKGDEKLPDNVVPVDPEPTPTPSPEVTPTVTPSPSPKQSNKVTPTAIPSLSPSPTVTIIPTPTVTPTPESQPTPTPESQPTPTPESQPTPSPTEEPTPSPEPTEEPTPTPEEPPTPTPTPDPGGGTSPESIPET